MQDLQETSAHTFRRTAIVYMVGMMLGALYVGIIAPLRTVVQLDMGISSDIGIWIINIYTLFYASTIPVSGSMADRYGRKPVFLICVTLFIAGATLCGLSQYVQNALPSAGFATMLVGRIIQACGAGGVMPVAAAHVGAEAPIEKRGMWLGVVSAMGGLANVMGATVGSLLVMAFGSENWSLVFFVALPVGVALLIAGTVLIPKSTRNPQGPLDLRGSVVLIALVACLLMGLTSIDYTDILGSLIKPDLWLPVGVAIIFALAFVRIERRAKNPVFHMEYLHNRQILIVMAISLFVGGCLISMSLVPEYAEAVLGVAVGTGGFFMTAVGIFAIVGPIICGKIIDKTGAKRVLAGGMIVCAVGFLILAFGVIRWPNMWMMILGMAFIGLGMGFTTGTPLNYMVLSLTPPEEASAAVATISLVRQIGTTLAPAYLMGYVVAAPGVTGYGNMMLAVASFCIISCVLLVFYRE